MGDKKFGHRYQTIYSRIWEDEKFINLSTAGQLIYLYLISNRKNNIPGFYILELPTGTMVCGLKDQADFMKHLREVIDVGMVKYERNKSLILITNFLKYNPIKSPSQLEGAQKVLLDLPKSKLFYDLLDSVEGDQIFSLGINAHLSVYLREKMGIMKREPDTPGEPGSSEDLPRPEGIEWVVTKWNEICGRVLPEVSKITDQRRSVIAKRIGEYGSEKIEEVFREVATNPFMLGENDRGWKADFDWVMTSSKFLKIFEGAYRHSIQKTKAERGLSNIRAVAEEEFARNQIDEEETF